jgi:hypothetical protein
MEAALNASAASVRAAAEAVATVEGASADVVVATAAAVTAALGEAQDSVLETNVRVKFCSMASPLMIPEVGCAWLNNSSSSSSSMSSTAH